jgi:predicted secreted hydrolase
MHKIGVPLKRLNHLGDLVINSLEKKELQAYQHFLKNDPHKVELDPVFKRELKFPESLYPQKNIPIEWWYLTGHLQSKERQFGYEFCFFKFHPQALRLGILPLSKIRREPFLVLHFALTDKNKNRFDYVQESGLSSPQIIRYSELKLGLKHSFLEFQKEFKLSTHNKIAHLHLNLKPKTPIVKHFSGGFAEMFPNHRTYYLTYPRLETRGKLRLGNKTYPVTGTSWFDHQKMNLRHRSPLKGWEWFSIHLEDKTELMFFTLRTKKGLAKKHLGGTYIDQKGRIINLKPSDAEIKTTAAWRSPHTKVLYPSGWKMKIKKLGIDISIIPEVKDQELHDRGLTPIAYWEGACKVEGSKKGRKIKGNSYVELVGYDKRFSTRFWQSFVD